jgi:threonine dehydrogenase-like Zn-dependent dehydrogenase
VQYPLPPGEPGHEAWGNIEQVGSAVRGVSAGTRCAFLSSRGFAEYAVVDPSTLVALPSCAEIFPGEALACALNIYRRSAISSGQLVALVGVGFIGALLVLLAIRSGARVIALSRREFSLQLARRLGASEAVSSRDSATAIGRVMELTEGKGCERVIEAAGTQQSLDLASAAVGTGGKLIIAGYHQDGPRQIDLQSWNWRGIDVINAHERDRARYVAGMRAAAAQIADGALDPSPLYTHSFSLAQCSAAFAALETRPPGFVKAIIRPGDGEGIQ